MQSGEQGSRFDVERAASNLMDATCDAYAVVRLEQERTQDQKVECPLQQISLACNTTLLQSFCMRVGDHIQNVNRTDTVSLSQGNREEASEFA